MVSRVTPSSAAALCPIAPRAGRRKGITEATNRNDTPLAAYAAAVPRKPTVTPARAAPVSRPAWWTSAPTPIAEGTSSRGTRSLPSREHAGPSTVAMTPVTAASTISEVTSSRSSATMSAVTKATVPSSAWLTAAVVLRGQRSTAAPPNTLISRAGAACTDMDRPVAAAEPVICSTSRFCTVSCIQVPALDTKFATDHQRMLRYRRERHGEVDAGRGGAGAGGGGAETEEEDTGRHSKAGRGTRRGTRTGTSTPAALRGRSTEPETAPTIVAEGTGESSPVRAPPGAGAGQQPPPATHLVGRVGLITACGRSTGRRAEHDRRP